LKPRFTGSGQQMAPRISLSSGAIDIAGRKKSRQTAPDLNASVEVSALPV
jgi:hypothetical protein